MSFELLTPVWVALPARARWRPPGGRNPAKRLQTARQRMLMDGLDATTAAYEVGYESVSQFSREYGRFFGQPPIRDIKSLRESNVTQVEIA